MENRNRNTALVLLSAGLYLLLGNLIGFFMVSALIILWFGIQKLQLGEQKTGYILIGIATILLLNGHLALVIGIVLVSLGYYYMKSKKLQDGQTYVQKQNILQSIKWRQEPWELKNTSIWSVIAEIQMDFSIAIMEEKDTTTIILQGIIADVDLIFPEDLAVSVEASVLFGQINVKNQREAGLINKSSWQSPHYETAEQRVKLNISYIVGDIDIKVV
jgi:lia operon protein LiaF